ncbi:hypothetical protein FOL47_010380 [Perkinsus chesapeaki]|uniref:Sterol 3-beta-glucosyltransferase n=1 Tax=Perkinsus chesapeaki TaxID=330153 RepID=A0A7J6N239_PERCH|nr:hypothetical protein FOL47_010380 [Perkinsus chesapeaki]
MIRAFLAHSPIGSFGGVHTDIEGTTRAPLSRSNTSHQRLANTSELRKAGSDGKLSQSELLRIKKAYEEADSETKDVNAGEYLFLGNFTMQFWNAFNNWNFRYWVCLLFVGFAVYTGEHLSTYFLTKAAISQNQEAAEMLTSPFQSLAGYFYFIIGPLTLLVGGVVLLLNPYVKHTHTIVATSILLTLFCEFVCVVGSPDTFTAMRPMSVPMVLFLTCMSSRLFPSVSFLAVALYLIGIDFALLVCSCSGGYTPSYKMMILAGVLCHWFVFGLCLVGSSNLLRAQADLFSLMMDRLQFKERADGAYDLGIHGVSLPMLSYFKNNYTAPISHTFDSNVDEKEYHLWARSRQTFWITRHMRWAVAGVLLLVSAMIFVAVNFHGPLNGNTVSMVSGVVVQVASVLLLFIAVCLTVVSFGKPRRLVAAGLLFFVSSSLFSCVYVYNFGRAVEDPGSNSLGLHRYGPAVLRMVWVADPGLSTIIASHVTMSDIGAGRLLLIDIIVTIGVIASSLFWLENTSVLLSMTDLVNFVIVVAVAFLYTLNLESHWRLLWAMSRDRVPTSPDTYVSVEGCATEFSTKTIISGRDYAALDSYLSLQSTRRLRDLLVKEAAENPKGWQQYIDLSFDNLDHAGEGVIETRMHRLQVVINGIVNRRPDLVSKMFPRPEGNHVPRMNITLIDVGSRGDVEPYIAVSQELNAMGHHCRICTHDKFRDVVEKEGVQFFPMALDAPGHWQPEEFMKHGAEGPSWSPSFLVNPSDMLYILQHTPGMMESLREIFFPPGWETDKVGAWAAVKSNRESRWTTHAMIANPPSYIHVHLAERLGVPLHMYFSMPWSKTKILGHPFSSNGMDDNPYWRLLSYRWFDQMQWRGIAAVVPKFRAEVLHIPKIGMWHSAGSLLEDWGVPFSYSFSPTLFPKPPDWGPNIDITGFCTGPDEDKASYNPPANLANFLSSGPKPFYIGFGSISGDLTYIFKPILQSVKEMPNLRVVLQKGWCELNSISASDFTSIPNFKERVFFICTPPERCPKCGRKPDAYSHNGLFCDECDGSSIEDAEGTWEYDMLKALGSDNISFLSGIPHDWLFPKCCAVMHHGGAGTTAMGLDFGLPTCVISFFGDQWIWGGLLELRGAGRCIHRDNASVKTIRPALEGCMTKEAVAAAKTLQKGLLDERDRGMGAHEAALSFQRQLPLELVTCELCRVMARWEPDMSYRPRAAEYRDTVRDIGLCPVCAVTLAESEGLVVAPFRTADWGRTRGGILYVHFVKALGAATAVFKSMIQGGHTGGVYGFFIGIVAGIFEFLVFIVLAPFVFIRDSWWVATQLAQGTADGRQHGGFDTKLCDRELLEGMVVVHDEANHDIRAVAKDTLKEDDEVLSATETTKLTERTERALNELVQNRSRVQRMTEAVCQLFERRGVGIELTAKNAYEEPLIERKMIIAAEDDEATSSVETTPEARPSVPDMAE